MQIQRHWRTRRNAGCIEQSLRPRWLAPRDGICDGIDEVDGASQGIKVP